jgi:cyclopropane-fatty-acyl-phospholipid synthase
MSASAIGFEDGGINVHQILGVVQDDSGRSAMPRTRDGWATSSMAR